LDGSEDADLDELGKFYLGDEKIVWDTKQTGAVGKMNTKGLDKLINRIDGELSVLPFGKELVQVLKDAYLNVTDIQAGTFRLLNKLFAEYGLIVLIPDTAELKKQMSSVFEEDLFKQTPSEIVSKAIDELGKHYKVQANPREINLFYLKDNIRERIIRSGDSFNDSRFTTHVYPIRNPHRACRPSRAIQSQRNPSRTLPGNSSSQYCFCGWWGETAYWLELKGLFEHYKVPFPVLILRNSFLFVEKKWQEKISNMGFSIKIFLKVNSNCLLSW
jgi:uncharacterized protein YllA (UPF0747 family)